MKAPELVSVTSPVGDMSAEESIAYMARVSSPNQRTDGSEKLLLFLMQHGHWSPFSMVDMTVEIHTSRAIMAQVLRHYSFAFQEFSQRYSAIEEGVDWTHVEGRFKHVDGNRQGSSDVSIDSTANMQTICGVAEDEYNELLSDGIAPESARMVMPLATPTRAYMKGSVRSWITYFWQRLDSHAQKEHRLMAEGIFDVFKAEFPVIAKLVLDYKSVVVKTNA